MKDTKPPLSDAVIDARRKIREGKTVTITQQGPIVEIEESFLPAGTNADAGTPHWDKENLVGEQEEEANEPVPAAITLSEEQEAFIKAVFDPQSPNILLLGKAGVGKSLTTRTLLERAREKGIPYLHGAPTGVAAINVGGSTLHSIIGTLRTAIAPQIVFFLIDEVSMCRADLLDELDKALRYSMRNPDAPFGGVKMVLVGDPFQLSPVVKKGEAESDYVLDNYLTPYFWSSAAYAKADWWVLELTKIYRQSGEGFPKLLNLVRNGEHEKPLAYLNRKRRTMEPRGVILTPTNNGAAEINTAELAKLPGEKHTFVAQVSGKIRPNEYPAEDKLDVKIGARVMVIKNIYSAREDMDGGKSFLLELVNGDVGKIVEIGPNAVFMEVERTGQVHKVSRAFWEKEERVYDKETKRMTREVVAQFIQFPLRLAWAITIHKSQGATIEELTLDVRRLLFATGQAYVALSRGVSLDGIHIWGMLREKDIMVCPHVQAFCNDYKTGVGIKPGSVNCDKWISSQKEQLNLLPKETVKKPSQEELSMDAKAFEDM